VNSPLRNPSYLAAQVILLSLVGLSSRHMDAQQISTLCHFTFGQRAGTNVDYAPRAPLPVGTPCNDGYGSVGVIIPIPTISTAYIPSSDLPDDPGPQRTPVTCWAASIAYVLAYYDHPVDQTVIWQRYYPSGPSLGSPQAMTDALNTTWVDANGNNVTISSKITNIFGLGQPSSDVDNSDVIDALTNNTPVFYGDKNHAMVLIKARYQSNPNGGPPNIIDGVVWDPNPKYHVGTQQGYRTVTGAEIQALFVAIPSVN
jgi:hypothetical protein